MDDRSSESGRRLVVVGDRGGESIVVLPRASLIGRDESADIRVPYEGVSRRHAVLDATGSAVVVVDQQSRNGTWVNGRRLVGPTVLHDGDRMGVGPVQFRFEDDAERHSTGESRRPAARGGDSYDSQRDQYIAAGNQTWNQTVHVNAEYDQPDAIFEGRGPGRVIAIIGLIFVVGGFGWFAWTLFSTAAASGSGIPEFPTQIGYAFGMFFVGVVLSGLGAGMSRARRRREQGRG
ncbi:FHA domain-containing protein [Agromyces sp. SYSU T00266]|uniref:FHA domain-containing protein n=1 Tax=Agromyces zhanjiangensis TaxID=3158562 RepID=UPI003396D135